MDSIVFPNVCAYVDQRGKGQLEFRLVQLCGGAIYQFPALLPGSFLSPAFDWHQEKKVGMVSDHVLVSSFCILLCKI